MSLLNETKICSEQRKAVFFSDRMDNNNPVYETAKETQMYRTVFWTLWERERVG